MNEGFPERTGVRFSESGDSFVETWSHPNGVEIEVPGIVTEDGFHVVTLDSVLQVSEGKLADEYREIPEEVKESKVRK